MSFKIFRGILCSSMAVGLAIASSSQQPSVPNQPHAVTNIVLVHGAWADGSNWSKVIPLLEEKGLNVVAVQLPLTSLQDDAATTKRAIELAVKLYGGPILLVGHPYGGTVITEVGNTPDVAGLVFVAAFAPGQGESSSALAMANPTPGGAQLVSDDYQFYKLTQQGIYDDFAQTLSVKEKQKLFLTQGPISGAALGRP
jgi:pimeloyl-ACP methyl ester carboxylesterase